MGHKKGRESNNIIYVDYKFYIKTFKYNFFLQISKYIYFQVQLSLNKNIYVHTFYSVIQLMTTHHN